MIYVSHRLDEIFRIADRVVVMRDGRLVGEKPVRDTNPDELTSALTRTEDSQRRRAVRVCWNGSDRLASPLGST
jgi:ABC-type sugar transport system ATPase subunit